MLESMLGLGMECRPACSCARGDSNRNGVLLGCAQVASDTLGVDLELVQLHNMMARACDLLHLQQARLAIGDFTRLVRHFCG